MAVATILSCAVFAAISGSSTVTLLAVGAVMYPALLKSGYSKLYAMGAICAGGTLGIIIPPSIPMILYAVMAGTSVVKMFVAGIVPGILGGLGLMGAAYGFARRYNLPIEEKFNWARLRSSFREAAWSFALPIIILGGIFGGFVTATEGAALAVVAALFLGLVIYRELDMKHLKETMIDGGVQTAVVMLLVATSALLGGYLTEIQAPQNLAKAVSDLTTNQYFVLALLNVVFLLLGMFLHSAAAIILVVPVVMPLVNAAGIDPVHFGLVVTLNLAIGQQTPPVASVLMVACSIAKASVWEVTKVNIYFIGVLFALLMLVTYVPVTGLGLVRLFYE
jgi:tripartite ATP-independent transporter DctM subunit